MSQPARVTGQLAPYAQEGEEALLGAVLTNPDTFLLVAAFLKADDFYIVRHRYLWEAYRRIVERDETLDFATVTDELRAANRLDDLGGSAYLLHLVNSAPDSTKAVVYGHLVERAAGRRRLLAAADEIRALALDETLAYETVGVNAWARLEMAQIEGARERYVPGAQSIEQYDQTVTRRAERRERGERVSIPIPERWSRLSEKLPALYLGDFAVISGASGSGKSALVEAFCEHCAMLGIPTDYIHTEMSSEEVLDRRMARHSGVSFHRLASGDIHGAPGGYNPYAQMVEADGRIAAWVKHLAYHWLPDVPFARLQMHLRRAAALGVKVFAIDHFQDIVPPAPKGGNEVRAFEAMCVWLNAFAEMRQVLVIVASQLNDQGKVKWSRKLVEKADVWLNIKRETLKTDFAYLLDKTEYVAYTGEESPRAEVIIGKARFGKKAKVTMLYHGAGFQWHDLSAVRTRTMGAGQVISLEDMQARRQNGTAGRADTGTED